MRIRVGANADGGAEMEIKADALVLRTADYGESDKMVTLFTFQKGKISAAAKGVRKAASKLRFAAQPFCFAEYVLAQKGDRYTIIGAAGTDGFYALREDVCKFYAAAALVRVCDALLFDGIVNEELFLRAVRALGEMCEGDEAEALIRFLIKALELSGYMLDIGVCSECGAALCDRTYFDLSRGCFTCGNCAVGAGVSPSTLEVLKKCSAQPYEENRITQDGKKRALKLLRAYFRAKTDDRAEALSNYIDML